MNERGFIAALAVLAALAAGACEGQSTVCVSVGCDFGGVSVGVSQSPLVIPAGAQARAYALPTGVPAGAPQTVSWLTVDTTVAVVVEAYDTAGLHAVIVAGRAPGRTALVVTADADPTVKNAVAIEVVVGSASAAPAVARQLGS